MKPAYWVVFVLCQLLGAFIPSHATIHSNIWPLFGSLLLAPGIILMFVLPRMSWGLLLAGVIPLNALCWYLAFRSYCRSADSFF